MVNTSAIGKFDFTIFNQVSDKVILYVYVLGELADFWPNKWLTDYLQECLFLECFLPISHSTFVESRPLLELQQKEQYTLIQLSREPHRFVCDFSS